MSEVGGTAYQLTPPSLLRGLLPGLRGRLPGRLLPGAQHAGHAGHDGSGESHFSLLVVSEAFAGLNRVQRQRLVFAAVGDLMDGRVHALQIQARTPDEA